MLRCLVHQHVVHVKGRAVALLCLQVRSHGLIHLFFVLVQSLRCVSLAGHLATGQVALAAVLLMIVLLEKLGHHVLICVLLFEKVRILTACHHFSLARIVIVLLFFS